MTSPKPFDSAASCACRTTPRTSLARTAACCSNRSSSGIELLSCPMSLLLFRPGGAGAPDDFAVIAEHRRECAGRLVAGGDRRLVVGLLDDRREGLGSHPLRLGGEHQVLEPAAEADGDLDLSAGGHDGRGGLSQGLVEVAGVLHHRPHALLKISQVAFWVFEYGGHRSMAPFTKGGCGASNLPILNDRPLRPQS